MSANKLIGDSLDRLAAGAATAGRMLGEMWDETLDVLAEIVASSDGCRVQRG